MNDQAAAGSMPEYRQVMIDLDGCRPEYQHPQQSSGVGGISFSPLHLLKWPALAISIAVIGTIPLPVEDLDLATNGIEVSLVFPSLPDLTTEDDYSRIREEIVASGLPMLGDEEIRAEIRDRKGSRGDTEP